MKHYIDIEALREEDVILNGEITRYRNDRAFKIGDRISISEKIDGSNASITYDEESNQIQAFSRKQELSFKNTLNGFYNFAQNLDPAPFVENPDFIVFGEWTGCRNKIVYKAESKGKWYVFDIYNKKTQEWYDRDFVKYFATKYKFDLVYEFYNGPFVSWDHCRQFMNSSQYGDIQEGIVVSNISEITRCKGIDPSDSAGRSPFILKLVNTAFKESMVKQPKEIDPEKEANRALAEVLMGQVVTQARVEKILIKLQNEEGVLPKELNERCMGDVAKALPKSVYEDLLKEEPEIVKSCGEYGGKICSSLTMKIARNLILGGN